MKLPWKSLQFVYRAIIAAWFVRKTPLSPTGLNTMSINGAALFAVFALKFAPLIA